MKITRLITCILIGILASNMLRAQVTEEKPDIQFSDKKPSVIYQKNKTQQDLDLAIKYTKKDSDNISINVSIKISYIGIDSTSATINPNPYKLTFGKNYPDTYNLKVNFSGDTSLTLPGLVRLEIIDEKNKDVLSTHEIFYQASKDSPIDAEEKLLKSYEEIKSNLNTLRAQILDGDTSRTYIGKLIIRDTVHVVPYNVKNLKDKPALDKKIKMASFLKNALGYNSYTIVNNNPVKNKNNSNSSNQTQEKIDTVNVITKPIDTVTVKIVDGAIEFLKVKLTDGNYYINLKSPISLLNIERRFEDKLTNPYDKSYIFLKDALNFAADSRFNYFPSNGTFYLHNTKKAPNKEVKVFANNGLNSFIDLRVFTDLLGTLDNQPNGLLQIEAKSKVNLHKLNLPNTFMYIFHGLEPYFGISKFDSQYDTVKIVNTSQSVNRMDLFQRSFVNVGVKLNMFRWDFRPSNSLYLNGGYQFNSSNIAVRDSANLVDSIIAKSIFHTPYFEVGISSKRLNNFGFEGEVKYMFQKLNDNKYFTSNGYNHLMNFSVTMFYFPGTKPKDKFFVRFSNYLNFKDRKEDFYQLQFGYSLNLKL